jgi:hypothetical protein
VSTFDHNHALGCRPGFISIGRGSASGRDRLEHHSLRDLAALQVSPQGDGQPLGESHDADATNALAGRGESLAVPNAQGTVGLVAQAGS